MQRRAYEQHATFLPRQRRALMRRITNTSYLRIFFLILFLWSLIDAYSIHHTYRAKSQQSAPLSPKRERIFIASIHWNNENILRSHWNQAVVELVTHLGKENVFVSIQESGSWDDSKGALRQLDRQLESLGISRQVILDETTHLDEISRPPASTGWIETPRGRTELRRIPYLSRLRNLVLEPLETLQKEGLIFDKILFLNDVIFNTRDIQVLLNTRQGEYAAACALDFSKPPKFYDTFALRDYEGYDILMQHWPYFRARASRHALMASEPVPVTSCWNGIAVMDAKPFYAAKAPLRFRGVSDSLAKLHVEGSECCLIHADNPLSSSKGVWLNPNVRVSYNAEADSVVNPSNGASWLSFSTIYWSSWENRLRRWFTTHHFKEAIVKRRLKQWKAKSETNKEPGKMCLINEMQVLVENGWAHV